jgi:hypothetical protein
LFTRGEEGRIIGAKVVSKGEKVVLHSMTIQDAIFDHVDLPVDLSDLGEQRRKDYEERVARWRQETITIENEIESQSFVKYLLKRFEGQNQTMIACVGYDFYAKNMDFRDKMPEDIAWGKIPQMMSGKEVQVIPSWHERRWMQWDREISAKMVGEDLVLAKMTRAAASMEPWDLSQEDAEAIERAINEGMARPKIEIKKCPEYKAPCTHENRRSCPGEEWCEDCGETLWRD